MLKKIGLLLIALLVHNLHALDLEKEYQLIGVTNNYYKSIIIHHYDSETDTLNEYTFERNYNCCQKIETAILLNIDTLKKHALFYIKNGVKYQFGVGREDDWKIYFMNFNTGTGEHVTYNKERFSETDNNYISLCFEQDGSVSLDIVNKLQNLTIECPICFENLSPDIFLVQKCCNKKICSHCSKKIQEHNIPSSETKKNSKIKEICCPFCRKVAQAPKEN